jgi:uncharacterized protein
LGRRHRSLFALDAIMRRSKILYLVVLIVIAALAPGCNRSDRAQTTEKPLGELQASALAGDAWAQFILGQRYRQGVGVRQDVVEAAKWWRKAAEQGITEAQFNLGVAYGKGEGVPKDSSQGRKWVRLAAEAGMPSAQGLVGVGYFIGTPGVTQDYAEAVQWLNKAAAQGDRLGQHYLGLCCRDGKGTQTNALRAVAWFRRGAEANFPESQAELGHCYMMGIGVERDPVLGVTWLRKGAEAGSAAAQERLAVAYTAGDGVGKDEVEAYKWITVAEAKDPAGARAALALLQEQEPPTTNQMAEARRRAQEFTRRGQTNSSEQVIAMP